MENPEEQDAQVYISRLPGEPIVARRAAGQATSASDVQVEDSSTQNLLRLRNGDYECRKRVFLVIDGERYEITVPVYSEESSETGGA